MRFAPLRDTVLFFAGLAAAATLIHSQLPVGDVPDITGKLKALAKQKDVNTVFIGSSLIRRQLDPASFDAALRVRGHAVKTFNAGIDGMLFPETEFFIDQILAGPAASRLKWMIIEFVSVAPRIGAIYVDTPRPVYWHDWKRTALAIERCFVGARSWRQVGDAWVHVQLFIKNQLNHGRGTEVFSSVVNSPRKRPYRVFGKVLGPAKDGYLPIHETMTPVQIAEFEDDLAKLRRIEASPEIQGDEQPSAMEEILDVARAARLAPLDPVTQKMLRRLKAGIEGAGIQPIFILPPDTLPRGGKPEAGSVTFWDFLNTAAYPELYKAENRYNSRHLNGQGALVFTALVADRMAQFLEGR